MTTFKLYETIHKLNLLKVHVNKEAFYFNLFIISFLVLLGGLLAGLTLGLMSIDEVNLQILINSGDPKQRRWAQRIQPIRKNGHLLLVTMMLANTLTNMSLPILIDGIFGGGLYAVIISTGLILVFGEVIPQAVCAKHGLRIGAMFAWPVRVLIWIMYPIAYPIAYVLDTLLGEDHGALYRRAELKELVAVHDSKHGGSLTFDEITIIRGALDLSEKTAFDVMTPKRYAFMIDFDCALDWVSLRDIQRAGHSRIPVYQGSRDNIIGLILAKSLILLDPNASTPLKSVKIYPVPKVEASTSLFELLNSFQEGTSHMAVVVEKDSRVPIGIITLEDLIEELIQEEIIDETDVYVDVPNKVRAIRSKSQVKPTSKRLSSQTKLLPSQVNQLIDRENVKKPSIFTSPKHNIHSYQDDNALDEISKLASLDKKEGNNHVHNPRPCCEDDESINSDEHRKNGYLSS